MLAACLFLVCLISCAQGMVEPIIVEPTNFKVLRNSGESTLYEIVLPSSQAPYAANPYFLDLKGTRHQIGFDYAALLQNETQQLISDFMNSMLTPSEQILLSMFLDYCWDSFLSKNTPPEFLEELQGMSDYSKKYGSGIPIDTISKRFNTIANMPADAVNIIAMLEQELEGGWPDWLKSIINDIIKILEKLINGCDAYGVWGTRTKNSNLYSSRNLDWNKNTGIDKFKLVTFFHIKDPKYGSTISYSTLGFSFGLGALAGMNSEGVTVSEMNLDNSVVTFSGAPFPLRLRYVLERSSDLKSAQLTWNLTNNTNSFNFLIASAKDAKLATKNNGGTGAYALETIMGFTSFYAANSPVEAAATFFCAPGACSWTKQTGNVKIGKPLPEAVWRSNHAFNPLVMQTQEPLFNDTVFRYDLMHDIFVDLETKKVLIDEPVAVAIAATLGTKGRNFNSCDPQYFPHGENVMSIAYAPTQLRLYIAWEQGGAQWRPAACNPFVLIDFSRWL